MASTLKAPKPTAQSRHAGVPSGAPPHVVVWEADGSPYDGLGYGHAVASRLAARGVHVTTVPLTWRRPSPKELSAPVHLVSGGTTPVDSQQTWVLEARQSFKQVLTRALDGEASITGICFGSQFIVSMLAGPDAVGPNPQGIEAGLTVVHSTDGSTEIVVSQFHYDHIEADAVKAIGGEVVLTNDHTQVQAFAIGSTIVGLQFHPELDPPATKATISSHRQLIHARTSAPASVRESVQRLASRWSDELFDCFVLEPSLTAA